MEVLVLDGESTDDSAQIVAEVARIDPRVRLLPNPRRLQADAFNLALSVARGEVLVRMDAHSRYASDYVASALQCLSDTGADNVGGVQRAIGTTPFTRALAAAVSSPFAAGDAKYRYATKPAWVDTVYLGAWRTATLQTLGGMRPGWAVNEDYELNIRLREAGGRIYLSPSIRSEYHVRGSWTKLARQYARYGFWKVRTLLVHPTSLRWRQLVAPTFVLALVIAPLAARWLGGAAWMPAVAYAVANLAASMVVASRAGWGTLLRLPGIFATIHIAWGLGFLAGVMFWPWRHGRNS